MTKTLRWIKFEALMIAIFLVNGRGLSKFNMKLAFRQRFLVNEV